MVAVLRISWQVRLTLTFHTNNLTNEASNGLSVGKLNHDHP